MCYIDIKKVLLAAISIVLCYDVNCMRQRNGNLLAGLRSRADAEITDQRAAHAKWKARTRALQDKLDEIEDKLTGHGVQWVQGARPQDIANAVTAIRLIDGLQQAKYMKTNRIIDLKGLAEDILASLKEYRDSLQNSAVRDDFSEIIIILENEYHAADDHYVANDTPADYR
jgi:hypothetical protein